MKRSAHWHVFTDTQKKAFLRKRNTLNARENRIRWKKCDREIEELFHSNEARIEYLEQLILRLLSELHEPTAAFQSIICYNILTADEPNRKL